MDKEPEEYAPQYSQRERVRYAIIAVVCLAILFAATEWWAFPQWSKFVETAHCRTVLGIPGLNVVFYVPFVGIPLLAAVSLGAVVVPPAVRSLRARQYPPPGQKMFAKVRIRTGRAAIVPIVGSLALVACLFAIATWGRLQVHQILEHAEPRSETACSVVGSEAPKANAPLDGGAMRKQTLAAGGARYRITA